MMNNPQKEREILLGDTDLERSRKESIYIVGKKLKEKSKECRIKS